MSDSGSQRTKMIIAAAALVIAGLLILRQTGGGGAIPEGYYFDTETGKRFGSNTTELPPIKSPSGEGKGVRAQVFACGSCDDATSQFIGWLERYPAEAKTELEAMQKERDNTADEARRIAMDDTLIELRRVRREVRMVEGSDWVNSQSRAAGVIYSRVDGRCGNDKKLVQCRP